MQNFAVIQFHFSYFAIMILLQLLSINFYKFSIGFISGEPEGHIYIKIDFFEKYEYEDVHVYRFVGQHQHNL